MTAGGLRGRYLRISGFDGTPAAIGSAIGRRKDALIYSLHVLRDGESSMAAEICEYPSGSKQYGLWLEELETRVAAAAEKEIPAFSEALSCGTRIFVFPSVSHSSDTDWNTPWPVAKIRAMGRTGELAAAAALAERKIAEHGRKGVLLQALAEIRQNGGAHDTARTLYLESVEAHRAEGNVGLLSALLGLATTLLNQHAASAPWPMQVITPLNEETQTFPVDQEDEAFEVLIETLFVEAYNPTGLLLLSRMIDTWEVESLYRVTGAFLAIDQGHPEADEVRERHASVADHGRSALRKSAPRRMAPIEMPEGVALKLQQVEAAYEPPLPDSVASARGLVAAAEWRMAQGDSARAERDARRAVLRDPFDGLGHATLADILCAGGRWEEARRILAEATTSGVHTWEIHGGLGRIASELDDHVESCVQLHQALALAPDQPADIKARLGAGYRRIGHLRQARAYLDAALAEDPGNFLGTLFLLHYLKQAIIEALEAGRADQVESTVAEVGEAVSSQAARNALHPEHLFVQAQVLAVTGQLDLAEATLRQASELDPDLEHVSRFLAALEERHEEGGGPASQRS
jgi:tetratricopeptide (TPR) repeat protein